MRLQGRVAIVTGAAQGIGAGIAAAFVGEGARVMCSDISDKGAATAASIGAGFAACDTGDKAQVDALIAATLKQFGRIDILVNNAGIAPASDFLDLTEAEFDRVLRVNLKGYFLAGQAAARVMVKQGAPPQGGYAIVNLSSVNAVLAIPNLVPYVVSKGGVNQLTRVMAMALVDHGIRVNGIGPGTIGTELAMKAVMANDAARTKVMSRTPMGRMGTVDEVAAVAVFLAGPEASYITGQIIYPDGGRLALNYTVPVKPA